MDAIYNGTELSAAIKRAAALGCRAAEFWGWPGKDIDGAAAAAKENGVEIAAFCTGNSDLTDPVKRSEYLAGLRETVSVARKLDCKIIMTQVGPELPGVSRAAQADSIVKGLKQCAPVLEGEGLTLAVEPLNTAYDHKGYYLSSSDECAEIITAVGSGNVKMLFDIYHQQITEGDVTNRLLKYLNLIGHIHCAGHPGRHEPENGELNYGYILAAVQKAGYKGFAGFEFFPAGDADAAIRGILKTYQRA
ncbi:hydroxypyruvate isomerase [Clostridia bacterium]|nr:hydroxypyruvate isomerase [Clostridia bacterium]